MDKMVYAVVAIFLLPINSALNPILYTTSTKVFKQKFNKVVQSKLSFRCNSNSRSGQNGHANHHHHHHHHLHGYDHENASGGGGGLVYDGSKRNRTASGSSVNCNYTHSSISSSMNNPIGPVARASFSFAPSLDNGRGASRASCSSEHEYASLGDGSGRGSRAVANPLLENGQQYDKQCSTNTNGRSVRVRSVSSTSKLMLNQWLESDANNV